ncbi:methyltransferase domain-containing protein [Candidatus Woesearchaeota archaeon]|nr:methyltransferase domain-containing protein [Candidatus Woesearchaeota archaeon]
MKKTKQSHVQLMDSIYSYQRFIYDPCRKFFLIGRDQLLERMKISRGDKILEVGAGTARNLIKLARRQPKARLYGIDASTKMLETADRKLKRRRLQKKIRLKHCLAEKLNKNTFNLNFDTIFFSYTLSMIPNSKQAINAALKSMKPKKTLYIIDFWDQRDLPRWFRAILKWWLGLFHVKHRPEVLHHLKKLEKQGKGKLNINKFMKRYAYIAEFKKR